MRIILRACFSLLTSLVLFFCGSAALAQEQTPKPKPAYPFLPEPMVYDLVRPLGARKGETEVNSLFQMPMAGKNRRLQWAPELEWAFADGYSFEFELPMENERLVAYKFAFQGTIGETTPRRFMQGWHTYGVYDRHERTFSVDMLYLAGYYLTPRWSLFTMTGARLPEANRGGGRPVGLFNPTVYYRSSPRLLLGVEANMEFDDHKVGYVLLMPQAQIQLNNDYNLQLGAGASRAGRGEGFRGALAMRFVRQL